MQEMGSLGLMLNSINPWQEKSVVETPPHQSNSGAALATLSLIMLLSSLCTSSANVALPTLARAFSASFQEVQWIVLAYLLAITTLIVIAGRLGDIVGRKRLLQIGLLLFTAASVLCGSATTLWVLIMGRVIQGSGAAIMMAIVMAMVGDIVPGKTIGRAMGLLGTMSAVGTALGPSLGGAFIAAYGWRAIFLMNLPMGMLAWFLTHRYLLVNPKSFSASRPPLDIKGSLLLAITLAAYALAMTIGRGRFGLMNILLLVASTVGVAWFLRVEKTALSPLVQRSSFRMPGLRAGLVMNTIVSTVVMATLVVGPFYLTRVLGLDTGGVGLVMTTGPLVAALTGLPSGRIVERFGAQRVIMVGLLGMAVGSLLFCITQESEGIVGYVLPLVFITAGYALFQTANNTTVMQATSPEQRGVISGLLNLSRNLGLITGTAAMGAVFMLASGATNVESSNAESVAVGMRTTFAVAEVLIIIAFAVSAQAANQASRAA